MKYSPDLVLLAFYTYNDVQNNHRALNPVDSAIAPYFVLDGDRLVPDESFRQRRSVMSPQLLEQSICCMRQSLRYAGLAYCWFALASRCCP